MRNTSSIFEVFVYVVLWGFAPLSLGALDGSVREIHACGTAREHAELGPVVITEKSSIVAPHALKAIAKDLANLVERSTGFELAVCSSPPKVGTFISLIEGCDIGKDGFIRRSPVARKIELCAKDRVSLAYAVTDFAERYLGVRWLFPGADDLGTYIPHRDTIAIPREVSVYEPSYKNRVFSSGKVGQDYLAWATRMRLVSSESAFHHNLYSVFPPERYYKSNPNFYPIHNGLYYPRPEFVGACKKDSSKCVEENHRWQPVLSEKSLLKEGIMNVRGFFDQNPGVKWFSLGMNDGGVWGDKQMEGRAKNSLGFVSMSEDFYPWATELATEVVKTHPKRKFGVLAYHNLVDPPAASVHESIVPYMTFDRMQWVDPKRRANDQSRTRAWEKKVPEIGWYDYVYGDQVESGKRLKPLYAAPRVYPHLMAEYLRFGRDHHVRHYYAEAYPSGDYWREGPKLYVLAKLLWNPDLDIDKLLDDWYLAAVGSKGIPYLKAYYEFWEDFWTQRVPNTFWFRNSKSEFLPFSRDGYLEVLGLNDQDFLQLQMDELLKVTRGTEFEARADFFYRSWRKVKEDVFGPRFKFEAGMIAAGYRSDFRDSLEINTDSVLPTGWHFWNRPDVGSMMNSHGITSAQKKEGRQSFGMSVSPDGSREAYALLYRTLPVGRQATRYCVRTEVRSPSTDYVISISFRRDGEASETHMREREFTATGATWRTTALCTAIPGDEKIDKLTVWLGVRGVEAKKHAAWFDLVEVFSAP